MFEFAKEMYFEEKASGNKYTRKKTLIKLLESSAIMAGLSKKSYSKPIETKTRHLYSNPNEHCDRLNLLLQETQIG